MWFALFDQIQNQANDDEKRYKTHKLIPQFQRSFLTFS